MDQNTKYKCKLRDKIYKSQSSLDRHVKSIHEIVRYRCEYCAGVYNQQSSLNRHFKLTHN